MKWAPYVCVCVVNIVNPRPAIDWPLLLHTLTDRDPWSGFHTNKQKQF